MKITINDITLSSDFPSVPAQGSANIPIEIENLSEKYIDYALVPCVGWLENGVVVSTTRSVTIVDEKNVFTLPAECFKNAGAIYISIGLIKDDIKIKTNEIVLYVGEAPDADVELPTDGTWETAVSSLVSSLFNERFENDINRILEEAQTLNQETENLQRQINNAINYLGDYEWSGTQIRFKKGDGTWGAYRDIAGDFASKDNLKTLNSYTKQLFLAFHPVGSVVEFTNETDNPQTMFGGTWEIFEKNHPTYTIVDSIVKNATGTDFIDLISWSQIVMEFQEQYNIIPMSQDTSGDNGNNNTVFVDVSNGHVEASYVKMYNIQWVTRSGERVIVVVFDGNPPSGQRVRINFKMTYVDKTITYYKWKRTA